MFTKNNKVLFIIHDVYQEDNQFPLGPAYLAAVLDEKGAYVEAYCMDIFHYTNEQLAEHLQRNEYDLIGVGFIAARFKETIIDLCKTINANKKNAWLILGGHGPSPIPEYVLKMTGAEIVVIGEAEKTIVSLLDCKINQGDLAEIGGIAYLKDGSTIVNERNGPIRNLDEIPFPLWDIFPMDKYATCMKLFNQKPHEKSLSILTSRGCINRCNFCYRMEKGIRLRSIGNIIEELKLLQNKYGVNCYFVTDELFLLNKRRLIKFEKGLKEANLNIKFICSARVDTMDKESIKILKRCGCQFIGVGFESSDNNVLRLMNKNVTAEQNIKVLEMVKKVGGMGIGLNFIWNNLGDNEDTLRKNVQLIKKYNTYDQIRTIRPVTPYPGSDLYYKLIEIGNLNGPEDFFEKFKNSDLMLVNNMDMPNEKAYELLLEANTELLIDHFQHTSGDIEEAKRLVQQFKDLYSGKVLNFRGARSYKRNNLEEQTI